MNNIHLFHCVYSQVTNIIPRKLYPPSFIPRFFLPQSFLVFGVKLSRVYLCCISLARHSKASLLQREVLRHGLSQECLARWRRERKTEIDRNRATYRWKGGQKWRGRDSSISARERKEGGGFAICFPPVFVALRTWPLFRHLVMFASAPLSLLPASLGGSELSGRQTRRRVPPKNAG